MTSRAVVHRKFVVHLTMIVLAISVLSTPAAQSILADGLVEVTNVALRILRIPCWLLDHRHCFSLDRLDPTCPQCM